MDGVLNWYLSGHCRCLSAVIKKQPSIDCTFDGGLENLTSQWRHVLGVMTGFSLTCCSDISK